MEWQTCSRGHRYRGRGPCPVCWPGRAKRDAAKAAASKEVDAYITKAPKEVRDTLIKLRRVIKKAVPKAKERISYGMPFYEYVGTGFKGRLIYFRATKKDIRVYIPPTRGGRILKNLKRYQITKSSFHFPLNKPFPFTLMAQTLREILKKIDR